MTATFERVRSLISRALHPGTPVEEARTSAVIACRLLAEHGPLRPDTQPVDLESIEREAFDRGYMEGAADAKRMASPPVPKRHVIASKYAGRCQSCGGAYRIGESIAWAKGEGAVHVRCAGSR
jgi:hypothetical protein